MSFILESIKQAERERKLGQKTPSISIEYTGANVEDIENNKMKWVLLSVALFVTALVVWGATYYFANKDRQYIQELALNNVAYQEKSLQENNSEEKLIIKAAADDNGKRDVLMAPVKRLHKSDLKSVKLISADEDVPKTKIENLAAVKKLEVNTFETKNTTREIKHVVKERAINPVKENLQPKIELSTVASKQELAEIYSDLSKIAKQETVINEAKLIEQKMFRQRDLQKHINEEGVHIETASYVAPEANAINQPVVMPKHAVRTGVPSFGELPYDIQEKIPNFNVSVHMFHVEPNQRRIRINGNMYTEGKSLQQDLALIEITRFGAIFDYQGQKFRLNVR